MEYPYGDGSALLVVGLGNPGETYQETKHNVGFMVIDRLAQNCQIRWRKGKGLYHFGTGLVANKRLILCKPQTFMNRSGEAVRSLASYHAIDIVQNLLIVCDDLNLDLGRLRLRSKGSDGGNQGLRSIINTLQTAEFPRLRVGIRTPSLRDNYPDYVLSPFKKKELPLLDRVVETARDAVVVFIEKGIDGAMNEFNKLLIE